MPAGKTKQNPFQLLKTYALTIVLVVVLIAQQFLPKEATRGTTPGG